MLGLERMKVLPQAYVVGLMFTYSNSRMRLGNMLLGKLHYLGTWEYFPLAMAFKTPLATMAAMLVALAVGAAVLRGRRTGKRRVTAGGGGGRRCVWGFRRRFTWPAR